MKKTIHLISALAGILLAAAFISGITGCTKKNKDQSGADTKKILTYGKSQGPYTVLFEAGVKPILEKKGYTFKVIEFSDLVQNDTALQEGEIDFNVEQHTAYKDNFNKAQNGDLVTITPIPTVPAGLFPGKKKSLDQIADGSTIAVPNDASNTARAYVLLQKAGWIKLADGVNPAQAKQSDIADNPHHLVFTEMNSLNIPAVVADFDYAVITGSIVYNAKIDPSTALLQETVLDHLLLQLVVKSENKDAEWVKDIEAAYHSPEFKNYLSANNNGLWYIPDGYFGN